MVQTKADVFQCLRRSEDALTEFGVVRCGVFGSFVRDEAIATSDVDVLVEFDPQQKTFKNFMRLTFFLEELLGRAVDVLTPESLSQHIGPRILAEVEYVEADQ